MKKLILLLLLIISNISLAQITSDKDIDAPKPRPDRPYKNMIITENPDAPKPWQDSRYKVKIISGDNVVIDTKTSLMWKQCSEGLSGFDCSTGDIKIYSWQKSLDFAKKEKFAEFNNWRVPNINELMTLLVVSDEEYYWPKINRKIFPNTGFAYWSSSTVSYYDKYAKYVDFFKAKNIDHGRSQNFGVRLVRNF